MIISKFNKKQNIYTQEKKKAQRKVYYYSNISLSNHHSDIKALIMPRKHLKQNKKK